MALNPDNYAKGFLVDEQLMGGVTVLAEDPSHFIAYVLNHITGEYLGYQSFTELSPALATINQVQRPWHFEAVGGCSSGNCGGDKCKDGGCHKKKLSSLAPGPKLDLEPSPSSPDGVCGPNCCRGDALQAD